MTLLKTNLNIFWEWWLHRTIQELEVFQSNYNIMYSRNKVNDIQNYSYLMIREEIFSSIFFGQGRIIPQILLYHWGDTSFGNQSYTLTVGQNKLVGSEWLGWRITNDRARKMEGIWIKCKWNRWWTTCTSTYEKVRHDDSMARTVIVVDETKL